MGGVDAQRQNWMREKRKEEDVDSLVIGLHLVRPGLAVGGRWEYTGRVGWCMSPIALNGWGFEEG